MARDGERLDGWKAIGAHFGRDRTTAIRWANQRGLPVHAVPGGKTRSVYALRGELDAWAAGGVLSGAPSAAAPAEADLDPPPAPTLARRKATPLLAGVVLLLALVLIVAWSQAHRTPAGSALALPRDPALARRYIQARDDLARRDAPHLSRALEGFRAIAAADPGYAPAQASLAEAYLLEREFGAMTDPVAFPMAAAAAARALALDSRLASAHRALGFVAYWWDHDRVATAREFERALALDPTDGVTHFWYANILVDNGDSAAAAREFAAAKLLQPGTPAVAIDEAWAAWSVGDDLAAQRTLEEVARQYPALATPHDCLAMVALARGDIAGYARETAARAALRGDATLSVYAGRVSAAVARDDRAALAMAMAERAGRLDSGSPRHDSALDAFFQSALGERDELVGLLERADRVQAVWQSAGFRFHIARRWQYDAEVMRLLRRRAPPPLA